MINEHRRQSYSPHVRGLVFINPPEKIVPSPIEEYLSCPGSKVAEGKKKRGSSKNMRTAHDYFQKQCGLACEPLLERNETDKLFHLVFKKWNKIKSWKKK